jgi:DNA-binding transcriptional ArsR family regulator
MATLTAEPAQASRALEALRDAAEQACSLMKVLGNPDRLMLLCELAQGERSVTQLQDALGIVQPTLSQQLAVLREEGLVDTRREGKNIHYRLASAQAIAVMEVLYQQFCAPKKKPATRTPTSRRRT